MADRVTLEQRLLDANKPVPEFVSCPSCGRARCRPFEIVEVTDRPDIPGDMACGQCLADDKRLADQADEKNAIMSAPFWQTPEGMEMKAVRDRTLDKWRWTIMPDSPLSMACQQEFKRFLIAWQRMTVDAMTKAAFTEPSVPDLEYAPLAELERNIGL